ncbi:hypothetical protein RFI_36266, partial [Reticulomyxa filosa]
NHPNQKKKKKQYNASFTKKKLEEYEYTNDENIEFPIVNIPSLGDFANPLTFPIKDKVLSKIIEISTESPYGHGTETKIGKEVRKVVELNSGQFGLKMFWLSSLNNPILRKIQLELAMHIEFITAVPYKFLVYEASDFFNHHVNTKYQKGHFGTLLLSLPTEEGLEGGSLVLSFEGKNVEWNPSQEEKSDGALQMDWLAFYTDISYEIKPATKGRRVMIDFNLIVPTKFQDDLKYFKASSKIETSSISLNDKRVLMDFFFLLCKVKNKLTALTELNKVAETLLQCVYVLFKLDLYQEIVDLIITMANDYRVIDEIKKLLSVNVYSRQKTIGNRAVCVVFSHSYTGHKMEKCEFNRANLKGRDIAIYKILSQVFHSFVTCCKINLEIDEFESDHDNNDIKCTFLFVCFFYWLKLFPCAYVNGLIYVWID